MRYTRLATVIVFIFIITGCQQSYQNSATPYSGTQNHTRQTEEPGGSSSDTGLAGRHANSTQTSSDSPGNELTASCPPQASDDKATLTATPDTIAEKSPVSPDQQHIDQALEFCNLAQEMWEAGKLEDAITHLDNAYYLILEIGPDADPEILQQKEDIRFTISKRNLEIYASRQIVVSGSHNEIPITMNDHVKREVKRLTGPERNFFIRALERSERYRPYIVAQLKEAGLPEEISWLPLIESGFKIRALSPARALGLWQFIPSTGHKFGLTRNYYIDERMDPEKSTHAAIAYLKELHNLFGDWTTALASYNCGEGRVSKIIRRQKINYLDNFWDLYQSLPRETARYVPRFLATLHIIQNLDTYGIRVKKPLAPIAYKTFEIKKQVRLKDIAKEICVNTEELKTLNPELRYAILPPETYRLKIPEDKAELFVAKLDKIKTTYAPPTMFVYHRVRRGETLSGIAKRYKTSVKAISRANNIYKAHRIRAGKVLKIPSRGYNSSGSSTSSTRSPKKSLDKPTTYKVRRGDNLWIIARKFRTTTKQIMATNKLSSTTLYAGQTLKITPAGQISSRSTSVYRVKSGDSPFLIAKKHNMSLNRLLALNHLNKRSKIFPGQKLIVE